MSRPILSYADAIIVHNAPIDPEPYFNPYDMLVTDTNVSIKWNPIAGPIPKASNKLNDISPAAGGPTTAPELANIEPGAGGPDTGAVAATGGQASSVACANDFLANVACAQ